MTPKRAGTKPIENNSTPPTQEKSSSSSWTNYLNFGESYSSLILGIIVVIVTTILLVFLVRDRNMTQQRNVAKSVSSTSTSVDNKTLANITLSPKPTIMNENKTPTVQPTQKPTVTFAPTQQLKAAITNKPSPTVAKKPTMTLQPTITTQPTSVVAVKLSPTPTQAPRMISGGKIYTVAAGDTLWKIAENQYGSGYNWVDIARANKLDNPNVITAGTKLSIPSAEPKLKTVASAQDVPYGPKITGTTYTVQKGDHLWGVAVRAYGNGYKWTEIAKLNNISSPSIIYSGQVLKLPRT